MKRPGRWVWKESIPLALILASLAGTLGLVVSAHRRALDARVKVTEVKPPATVPAPQPLREKPTPPPPQVVQLPPPPPPPAHPPEDPTGPILARIKAAEEAERDAAGAADRRAQALETARKSAAADLDRWNRREALVHSQVSKLSRQAFELEQQAEELTLERDALARERDAAKAALAKASTRGGGYAVLPNKSENGTWQRPVVIECKNGEAVLQPHGLSYTMLDLSALLGVRSSPFVAAVGRELARVQQVASPDGSPVVPYIYFIVRPDGIRPYYEARARLEPLGIAFGYELVNQDWEIEFPDLETWDESKSNRAKSGSEGQGSGAGEFAWPSDRPGTNGLGDDALWPRRPPGGVGQADAGSPFGPGEEVERLARGGVRREPRTGSGVTDRPDRPGDNGGAPGGRPSPRAGGRPLPEFDPRSLLGQSLARSAAAESRGRGDATGLDVSKLPEPIAGRMPGPGTGPGTTSPTSGLSRVEPSGLPGFDPASASGEKRRTSGGASNPSNSVQSAPPGAVQAGQPSMREGERGTTVQAAPPTGGRVRLDPSMLNPEGETEDRPPTPPLGLRPQGTGAGRAGGRAIGTTSGDASARSRPVGASVGPMEVDVPLEIVVACGPNGVVIHPGGYRLSLDTLKREKRLRGDLETIVRNHELIDPTIHPRPKVRFLVEAGGGETYWEARQQTVMTGLEWPVSTQVAESSLPRVFHKDRF